MAGILVLGVLLGSSAVALRRPTVLALLVVVTTAAVRPFVRVEGFEGPVLVTLGEGHGIHAGDLLSVAVIVLIAIRLRTRRGLPGPSL